VIRRAALDRVAEMDTTRIPWTLHDHAGNEWAQLDDDDVTIVAGPKDGLRYRQIELERTGESTDYRSMSAIAETIQHAGAKPDDQPKLAKALGLPAARYHRFEAEALPASTAADVVRHAIFDGLERLLDHDYRLRLHPDDPDRRDVHQARVATRRLRSNLTTLRPLLDPIWVTHTESELRWIGAVLGAVRDADVMGASLTPPGKKKLSRSGSDSVAELRTKLAAERANAVVGLGEALGSPRYLDLLDRLHAGASHPPLTGGSDHAPEPFGAAEVLPKLVRQRLRRMEKRVDAAGRSPTDEQLHRIRIAAKNLRYASELSQSVIGKAARKTAKLSEAIQTVLGDCHDAAASIEWLTQAGGTGRGSGVAVRVLIAEQDRRHTKLAKQWKHQWVELSRPSRRRWLA
jgi:CHAD domain-containing protein